MIYLRWVDRDRALSCITKCRCLPSPWQLSDLERMLHANCTDQITWPRLHRVTRGAHTLDASMLCLWRCGLRGCISLDILRDMGVVFVVTLANYLVPFARKMSQATSYCSKYIYLPSEDGGWIKFYLPWASIWSGRKKVKFYLPSL